MQATPAQRFILWLTLGALAACSAQHEEAPAAPKAMMAMVERQTGEGAPPPAADAQAAPPTPPMLAYEHSLTVGTAPERVAALHEAVLAACRAVPQSGCTVLDARLNTGRWPGASARLRVQPNAVAPLVAAASAQGEVQEKSTTVEDLAAPLGDAQKRVALLTSYRTQLEGLRARTGQDVDAAMKVAKELAQVQNELESVTGEVAHLTRRVKTEVLTIQVQSRSHLAFWGPIGQAVSEFAGHVAQALAALITFLAYALPWGAVLGVLLGGLRWGWRRWRRARAPWPPSQG